jgi:hypothetical protein
MHPSETNWEGMVYCSVFALPIVIIIIVKLILKYFFKNKTLSIFFPNRYLNVLLIVALFYLCASMAFPFNLFPAFTEKHLSLLLSFRGIARMAWVFYYVFKLLIAFQLSKAADAINKKNKMASVFFILLILVFATIDICLYKNNLDTKHFDLHPNHYTSRAEETYDEPRINYDAYQALLTLPITLQWSGEMDLEGEGWAWMYAMGISYQHQIPIIDAKLSRMSVLYSLQIMQLGSHPLINRNLLKELPNRKPILLLCREPDRLSEGERYLLSKAARLFENKNGVVFYSLSPDVDVTDRIEDAKYKIRHTPSDSNYIFKGFNESTSPYILEGKGGLHYSGERMNELLFASDNQRFHAGDSLELSFWLYCDPSVYGNPHIHFVHTNARDSILSEQTTWFAQEEDTYQHWLRCKYNYVIQDPSDSIKMIAVERPGDLDALMLKRKSDQVFFPINGNDSVYLFNNYFIHMKP